MASRHPANSHEHTHARVLAQRVRSLREDRGWSRERLAKEAGIPASTLGRLENAGTIQSRFFTAGALAEDLGLSLGRPVTTVQGEPGALVRQVRGT